MFVIRTGQGSTCVGKGALLFATFEEFEASPSWYACNETTRSYTANNTWETIANTTVAFTADGTSDYVVTFVCQVRGTSANWEHVAHRVYLDSGTSGVTPTYWLKSRDGTPVNTETWVLGMQFVVEAPSAGSHSLVIQTWDGNSSLDRSYYKTLVTVTGDVLAYSDDETSRTYTGAGEEEIAGTATTFTADGSSDYLVTFTCRAKSGSHDVEQQRFRCFLDDSVTGVSPSDYLKYRTTFEDNSEAYVFMLQWVLSAPSSGEREVDIRTYDNGTGLDRNFTATLVTVMRGERLLDHDTDDTTRTYTANNTWETIANASVTFTADGTNNYIVTFSTECGGVTANWEYIAHRALLDGSTTGVCPVLFNKSKQNNPPGSERHLLTAQFILTAPSADSHTVVIQTSDTGSNVDRTYWHTALSVI